MKSAIILVYPRIQFEENYPCSWIPFSVLAVAGALPKDEFNVIVFDENRKSKGEFEALLKQVKNLICVGFSVMTGGGQIGRALELAQKVKQIWNKTPVVFGGPHVNVLPEETMRHPLVDIVLSGPGQASFPLLIQALRGEIGLKDVPGIMAKVKDELVCGNPNKLKKNTLVPYDFGFIDVNDYVQDDSTIAGRTINYISSQGCAHKCRFCYETNYRKKWGKLPCENVVADIESFVTSFNADGIKFYDADWFVDFKRSENLIEELTRLNVSWAASIHPKDILRAVAKNQPLLAKLAAGKCKRLLMGIESGSDRVLREIVDKGAAKAEIFKAAKAIADCGILGSYTFIVGFPDESAEEQGETFEFIKALWDLSPRPETRVHIYTPYPGTPLYGDALAMGFSPPEKLEDWSDFDYYKAQTPWADTALESKVKEFTSMVPKIGGL